MSLVPRSKDGKISFFTSKITPWTTNATAIGTTTTAVTGLNTALTNAVTKVAAQVAAAAAAKAATDDADAAVALLDKTGADIISAIRTKARTAGDSVYTLAQIPVPATPKPTPAPGTPNTLGVTLQPNGTLDMAWKCQNPSTARGTVYQIFRRDSLTGAYNYLGGSGEKKFTDTTIPAGATQLTYQIQAVRSSAVGTFAEFNVNFGSNAGGTVVTQVANATPVKMAA